jgi:hypothetical protein
MKKLIMMFCIAFAGMMISETATAEIVGVTVTYKRGIREWDATRTKTECVGRGLCEVSVGGTIGGSGSIVGVGTLGFDENKRFALSFSADILRDPNWKDTFVDGILTVTQDVLIDRDIIRKLPNCPPVIKPGRYKYVVNGNEAIVYFN